MLIAGLSEFLIIASLIWIAIKHPFAHHTHLRNLLLLCLFITAVAASLGAIKYLTAFNTQNAHSIMTYISKYLAMPAISLLTLFHFNNTATPSRSLVIMIRFLIGISILSFALNTQYQLGFINDGVIIFSLILACWSNNSAFKYISIAILCLASTLLWGAIITDQNIRTGVFHSAVALFFLFLGTAYSQKNLKTIKTKR